ncbi:MAG: HAD-IA family hydrolase [Nitrospirae bacterium]|nr:HAD-IA family hydrolase [Nitrospirota bacterium]
MPVKLIIFDLDGTLVYSIEDISNALNHALARVGLPGMSIEETLKCVGGGVDNLVKTALVNIAHKNISESDSLTDLKETVLDSFLEYYSGHITDFTRPCEGVVEALEALSGYKKAVVSNKPESLSRKLLRELNMDGYFEMISGGDSFVEMKPSPVPIIMTMEKLKAAAGETVMVGDSKADVNSGRMAGVRTIAAAYGYRPANTLGGADFLIEKALTEIIPIIRKIV